MTAKFSLFIPELRKAFIIGTGGVLLLVLLTDFTVCVTVKVIGIILSAVTITSAA